MRLQFYIRKWFANHSIQGLPFDRYAHIASHLFRESIHEAAGTVDRIDPETYVFFVDGVIQKVMVVSVNLIGF